MAEDILRIAVMTSFDQIAPQLVEIIRFLGAEDTRETTHFGARLRRRLALSEAQERAEEDAALEEQCLLHQLAATKIACQLALECAETQNQAAKGTAQGALGVVISWNEFEKQRDAQERQRERGPAAFSMSPKNKRKRHGQR